MATSSIEWTQKTWNPTTGCTKCSAGCKHCYAEKMSLRCRAMGLGKYENGFEFTLHEDCLEIPIGWKKPQRIFVNSMSDLFHEKCPLWFIQKVFDVVRRCPQHTFQILTKRSEKLLSLSHELQWPSNLWMGVSVEDERVIQRIGNLVQTPAKTKFLSLEPLIGPLEGLSLENIDWVIVGGESGSGARPMKEEWVQSILRQCRTESVPFFFKQWGGVFKKRNGRTLNGKTYDEMPIKN